MIKNMVNGKMYIGKSVNIEKRWVEHKYRLRENQNRPNEHLQRAWNKDGETNFEFTVICECDESQLDTMEIEYISKLRTYDPDFGYNKTYGGEGARPTEETKHKISESGKGRTFSEKTKRKISESQKGKIISEEQKKKISESLRGRTLSEDHKKNLSKAHKGKNHPFYGKHHSEETKRKLNKPIVQIDPSTNIIVNVWGSGKDAGREEGFHSSCITRCCKGKLKTHKGYRWQYLKDWLKEHNKGIPKKLYFID